MELGLIGTAVKALRKRFLANVLAATTIALGVGASTALFTVANAVLLRPLPYKDPNRIVIASMDLRKRDVRNVRFSFANLADLRDQTKSTFEDFAGVETTQRAIVQTENGTPEQISVAGVTPNFFRLLGANIAYGRDFSDQDGLPQPPRSLWTAPQTPPLPYIGILSYEYFVRRYGGNPAILGHPAFPLGQPGPIIVGVLAPGFKLYFPPEDGIDATPDVWAATRSRYDRDGESIYVVGKLRHGVPLEEAQASADVVAARIREVCPFCATAGFSLRIQLIRQQLAAAVRPAILALLGSGIFLLLIAYANVTNLALVSLSVRERELAVRAALGATCWRLLRSLIVEAVLLAGTGTVAGLMLAAIAIRSLRTFGPADIPRLDTARIDFHVLGFAALAAFIVVIVVVLAPAWRISRSELMDSLHRASQHAGLSRSSSLRKSVVVLEIALAFVLLIGSGLMFRSFLVLQRIDPGFDSHGLLTFQVLGVNRDQNSLEKRAALIQEIRQQLQAIPGVQSVTGCDRFPLARGFFGVVRWGTDEALSDASKYQEADQEEVLPGYFETMHIPVLDGRTFTDADNVPGRKLLIVDEFLAKKAFPGQSAVGKRILVHIRTPDVEWVQVIGVVQHVRATSLAEPGREQIYITGGFEEAGIVDSWAARITGQPVQYEQAVRAAVKGVDSTLLVTGILPADALIDEAQTTTRFTLLLIGSFGMIAGLLAGIGIYGVLSSAVRQRTAEIGIRVALGAKKRQILELVLNEGFRLMLIGLSIGLAGSFVLTRLMSAILVGTKPADPLTFVSIAGLFFLIAASAAILPAMRASSLDPADILRHE